MGGLPTAYREKVTITRGSGGGYWDENDVWHPADEDDVIFEGMANVQSGGLIAASRRSTTTTYAAADGVLSVSKRDLAWLYDVLPDDHVHIRYQAIRRGGTAIDARSAEAKVLFVRPDDRAVLVQYV